MKNIFIGNLPFSIREDEVRQLFTAYGQVDRVHVVINRDSGRPRGFGFVAMASDWGGEKAVAPLNGTLGAAFSDFANAFVALSDDSGLGAKQQNHARNGPTVAIQGRLETAK
jgi:RNA recognition motif-containing protein